MASSHAIISRGACFAASSGSSLSPGVTEASARDRARHRRCANSRRTLRWRAGKSCGRETRHEEPSMSILNTDKTLPANKLIFEVRRDAAKRERFRSDLEGLMRDYGLSEEERRALREADLRRLGELGMHPYFLPQVTRLFKGAGYNHNQSEAAQLYAAKMLKEKS